MKSKFVDKFVYDKKEDQRIITHEGMMREAYAKAVACYSPLFAQYGCSLEVSLYWVDFSTRKCYDHRLPFRIGYACYICCEEKLQHTNIAARPIGCRKCGENDFSVGLRYEYPDTQELKNLGIAEVDNGFTWIWVTLDCNRCSTKYRNFIDFEMA